MSLLVPLLLLALWLIFSTQGASFLAFLFLVAGVITLAMELFSGGKKKAGGKVTATNDAIIVENNAPEIPSLIKVKIKPNWSDMDQFEKDSIKMGDAFNVVGKTIMRVIRGKKKK